MQGEATRSALRLVPVRVNAAPEPTSKAVGSQRRRKVRVAGYALGELIAHGGMATVWRATAADGREVALKRMLPSLADNPRAVIMFSEEALLGMRLRHPRLVHTFELGVFEKEPFLVMELVRGASLADSLSRSAVSMRPAAAVFIVQQLLEALGAMHELCDEDGIAFAVVHRDVSPANMLVSSDGDLKLGDFGIAQITNGALERRSSMQGKVGYMAPEQLAGEPLDARADLFAVGVVLLELLTGRRAFARDHELATLTANYAGYAPGVDAAVPAPLARVLKSALAQRREERFPSARAFADALDEASAELALSSGRELLTKFLRESTDGPTPSVHSTVRSVPSAPRGPAGPRALPDGARIESGLAVRVARAARALATGRAGDYDASLAEGLERRRCLLAYRFGSPAVLDPRGLPSPAAPRAALSQLSRQRATGLLVARSAEREMRVFFDEGAPIFIASTDEAGLLGQRLVREGHVSETEVELAVERASRWDCPMGEALVDMGIVSARLVFAEIRAQMAERLRELGSWTTAELAFVDDARPGLSAVRLRPQELATSWA